MIDALIASVAVAEGALLVTDNVGDFTALATHMPVRVEPFDAFSARL